MDASECRNHSKQTLFYTCWDVSKFVISFFSKDLVTSFFIGRFCYFAALLGNEGARESEFRKVGQWENLVYKLQCLALNIHSVFDYLVICSCKYGTNVPVVGFARR